MKTEARTSEAISLQNFPGKPLEAYYLGKKTIYTHQYGEQLMHEFQKKDGTTLEVWGFDLLNRKLSGVPNKCMVEIVYLGKETNKKDSTKTYHNVKVVYDPDIVLPGNNNNDDNDDLPF